MLQDLKFALRSLSRNPLFAAGAIVTLALGMGVNTTVFSIGAAALFRPLAGIAAPDRLVWISASQRGRSRPLDISYPDYVDLRNGAGDAFEDLFAFRATALSLGSGGDPERIRGHIVTGSYFPTLGVMPAIGRLIGPADDVRGDARAVAVISDDLWRRRFGASPDIIDQRIVINGRQVNVAGVAPPGFIGPRLGEAADVWIPIALWPALHAPDGAVVDDRRSSWLTVMGRLRSNVDVRRAQAALSAVAARLAADYPATHRDRGVVVGGRGSAVPPSDQTEIAPLGAVLLAVTSFVLLIACANVANLLLARGAGRSQEIAIRTAIGAGRGRLLRQLLTESAVIAIGGAAAGLLLSLWAADLIVAAVGPGLQGLRLAVDPRVLGFTVALTVASVFMFGLVPALATIRGRQLSALRETAAAGGRSRLQGVFVVAQLALSLVLLLAAGLSLRVLQQSAAIDLGFDPAHVLTASYDLVLQNYPEDRRAAFRRDLVTRVRTLPGVASAALANVPPLSGTMVGGVAATASAGGAASESRVYVNGVGPAYFATLTLPLVRGREFEDRDDRSGRRVAIVNETLAMNLWGRIDVIGQELRLDAAAPYEVVGVARDSKYDEPTEPPRPFLYLSLQQAPQLDRETILVKTASAPAAAIAALQAEIRALDPALPVFDVRPFERVLEDRADKQRAISGVLAAFGALALLLAAVGLYGVMAYAVTRRMREMGIRLALGATPAQLTALVAGDGLRLALVGTAIGATLALPLTRLLGAVLFGAGIGDWMAFAAVCGLLIAVAMLAALLPARRASRLDPVAALRSE